MTTALKITDHLGLQLAALYDEPTTPGPHALVIMLHGFTGWKEEEHIATLAVGLATAGIAALRFDAPGSGESEGTWAEDYRVSNYVADVTDVYNYATENLNVDRARIAIWGHSMGGMTAILAAARTPDIFKAVCGSQPSPGQTSLASTAESDEWEKTGWRTLHNSHFPEIRLPYAFYLDRADLDTAAEAEALQAPLLLIAGSQDKLVSAASVRGIYDAANKPKQFLEYSVEHDYKRHPTVLAKINSATVSFFREQLSR